MATVTDDIHVFFCFDVKFKAETKRLKSAVVDHTACERKVLFVL